MMPNYQETETNLFLISSINPSTSVGPERLYGLLDKLRPSIKFVSYPYTKR
ncbi:unnamed protein product [Callosobruchus maculatus]|uniref:Uncharacterized protein n=1 Tax=Callosobruchus maculatus TaxID=64391 RepID=A0A653BKA8_CALMS|nr:unnamed protein product [Callosobruchus maculatus]